MEYYKGLLIVIAAMTGVKVTKSDTYILYDTKTATSDLSWTLHPSYNGWEELSGLDVDGNTIRSYQVCNTEEPDQDNWARSPYIDAKFAKRVYIDIEFSVMKCQDCRETFTLYYYASSSDVASSTFPPWRENPFIKIDTVAASERFDSSNAGPNGINKKTLVIGPLQRSGFYIAAQDQGACMSLMSMKLYYHYCPELTYNLAYFPKTVAGGDIASLISVDGKCVSNAVYTNNRVPKYRCNSNGEWKVPTGMCQCRPGYSPSKDMTSCRPCAVGTYKSRSGNQACTPCPSHSLARSKASTGCTCQFGYFRATAESIHQGCTRPPSGPLDLTYQINKTTVNLKWIPPAVTGDRDDLYYKIDCAECDSNFKKCSPCSSAIGYIPATPSHVTSTSMAVTGLQPLFYYVFKVSSHNGVSSSSGSPQKYEEVQISTSEAVPSAVLDVQLLEKDQQSLTLRWSAPQRPSGKILNYEVQAKSFLKDGSLSDSTPLTFAATTMNVTITGLASGTTYQIRVRARTIVGEGRFSVPVTYATDLEDISEDPSPISGGSTGLIAGIIGGVAFILLLVVLLLFFRYKKAQHLREEVRARSKLADGEAGRGLLRQDGFNGAVSGGSTRKTYVDYRDPHQGVKEVACEIDVSRIKIERVIGRGEFGEVCKGKLAEGKDSSVVAVKRLRHGASLIDQTNFLREACTMAQFQDANIVQFKGVVTKSMPAMIITEFMENGSLDKFLQKNRGNLSVLQLLGMLRGVASGMRYLSGMKYVHRDLAARNILVNSDNICKVSDFGLSRTLENDPHATYTTQGGKIALRWTAPECIRYRQFTSASDVWSFGIVMWEVMSYGEKPYWDMSNDDVTEVIEDGYRLPAPIDCPQVLHNLMLQCWSYEARRRPTFQEILGQLDKFIRQPSVLNNKVDITEQGAPLLNPDSPTSLQDVSNLEEWLDMVKLGRYRRSFYDHGINDLQSLAHITPNDLERLGIASPTHRSRLQSGLDTLRRHLTTSQQQSQATNLKPGASSTLRHSSDASPNAASDSRSFTLPLSQQRPVRDVSVAMV